MTRKRILLLADLKYRDLGGLALVKVLLERLGPYEVVLASNVPGVGPQLYLRHVKPHLVAFPQMLDRFQSAQARYLKQHGIGVAVIPTEGASLREEIQRRIAGKFVDLDPVDLFFIWNKTIAELVQTQRSVAPERCVVAGVPRFDFYHPRFRGLILSKEAFCERYAMDPKRPIVTWATNFGYLPFADRPVDAVWKRLVNEMSRTNDHFDPSSVFGDIPALIDREEESRHVQTEGVLQIARQFPEVHVVIKVHPAEANGWYKKQIALSGLRNVRVITHEYIWNVLSATNVHLHRSCTTALEAWLLGKPTVDLQFAPREWHFSKELVPGGDVVFSLKECLRQVRRYLDGNTISPQQQSDRPEIINWFCGRVDGQSATRHAEAMHRWLSQSREDPVAPRWDRRDLLFALTSPIKSLLGLEPYHSLSQWFLRTARDSRGKFFTQREVQTWVHGIQQTLNGAGTASRDTVSDEAQRLKVNVTNGV